MAPLHWTPSATEIRESALNQFRLFVNERHGTDFKEGDYWSLHAWSISNPENINHFWNALWDWSGVIGDKGAQPLFDATVPMYETGKMARHAHLNWAENMLLAHKHARSKTQLAVVSCIEPSPSLGEKASRQQRLDSGFIRKLTFAELYLEVARAASGLRKLGVGPGDKVAALTPNNAEAVIMVLATSSLGAVWSSSPPEFGVSAILERFTQLRPKVLLSADKYRVGGKEIDILPKLAEVVSKLATGGLRHVVLVGQLEKDRRPKGQSPTFDAGVKSVAYPDFLDQSAMDIKFWRGPATAPLWVLYSSGTTGKPKAIVHNQMGMTFEMKKQGLLHNKLQAGDCQLQITTTGWMMWNQMVNQLSLGMCLVVYDGNPFYPNKTALFDLIDEHKVTSFSLSPRYLQILLQEGYKPRETHSLKSLKTIFSAGSPLKAELYDFIRNDIKDVFINNGSGGTDVCAAFIGANPILPIYAGVIQCPMLGIKLECFDDVGKPVKEGEEGDLVISAPFPNLPLAFLGDDEKGTKLKSTYFTHYPDKTVWYQADYMSVDPKTKGITMLGRSDGVLNPQGVRFGSAELYTIVEEMKDAVDDCIAVGQKTPDGDERVVLFVKPLHGARLSRELVTRIQDGIRTRLSRRHVPAKIIECQDIPYTVNAKRVEVAVKKVVNGAAPSSLNTSGMLNPKSLEFFVKHPELGFSSQDTRKGKAKL